MFAIGEGSTVRRERSSWVMRCRGKGQGSKEGQVYAKDEMYETRSETSRCCCVREWME
jgi:hypothetical protein